MNVSLPKCVTLNTRVRHRRVGDEGVVVCMHNGAVLVVNEVGSHIIHKLAETSDTASILESVCHEFEVPEEQASLDFGEYLRQLVDKDVVSVSSEGEGVSHV